MEDFFHLYENDYNTAFQCFHSSEFIIWLREQEDEVKSELYKKCKLNNSPVMALQNFLQILDFDVIPNLQVMVMDDTIVIQNKGKGYLYGKLQYDKTVETDIDEWSVVKGELRIICRGRGKVHIISNGGCKTFHIEPVCRLKVPMEREYKEINLEKISQKKVEIKGNFDIPIIFLDNCYIKCYCIGKDIIMEKDLDYVSLLKNKLKHISMVTNVKLIYPEKILYIRVKVS